MDHAVFISHNFAGDLGAESRSGALRCGKQRSPPLGRFDSWFDRYPVFISLLPNADGISFWYARRRAAPGPSALCTFSCRSRRGSAGRSFAPHPRHSAEVFAYLLSRLPFVPALDRGNRSAGFQSQADQRKLAAKRPERDTRGRFWFCHFSRCRRVAELAARRRLAERAALASFRSHSPCHNYFLRRVENHPWPVAQRQAQSATFRNIPVAPPRNLSCMRPRVLRAPQWTSFNSPARCFSRGIFHGAKAGCRRTAQANGLRRSRDIV